MLPNALQYTSQPSTVKKYQPQLWLVELNGLSASLGTKKSLVLFPVRADALVAGSVPSPAM